MEELRHLSIYEKIFQRTMTSKVEGLSVVYKMKIKNQMKMPCLDRHAIALVTIKIVRLSNFPFITWKYIFYLLRLGI